MNQFFTILINQRRAAMTAALSQLRPAKAARLLLLSCLWLTLSASVAHAQEGGLPRVRHVPAPGVASAPAYQSAAPSLPSRRYQIDFEPDALAHILEPLGPDAARGLEPNQIGV